jgi:hypothetical protein
LLVILLGLGIQLGNFHKITQIAATIWKNMGGNLKTCEQLISQLMRYKTNAAPYNMLYDSDSDSPLMWWLTCEDKYNHLQSIAIKIFSVIPHSAGCERVFSHLGWMYGKTRQRLNLKRLEDMSKIHSFYFSNCKKEFNYFGQNLSEDEVKKFLIDSAQLFCEETESDEEELFEIDEDNYEELDNFDNNLDIEDIMNLNEIASSIKNDSDSDDSFEESEIQEEENTDYDPQELVKRILDIENDYGDYESDYENDYKNNNRNYNKGDDENDNKSNNSLDIENDNSNNSGSSQTAKVVKFSKTHNLRKRKHTVGKDE